MPPFSVRSTVPTSRTQDVSRLQFIAELSKTLHPPVSSAETFVRVVNASSHNATPESTILSNTAYPSRSHDIIATDVLRGNLDQSRTDSVSKTAIVGDDGSASSTIYQRLSGKFGQEKLHAYEAKLIHSLNTRADTVPGLAGTARFNPPSNEAPVVKKASPRTEKSASEALASYHSLRIAPTNRASLKPIAAAVYSDLTITTPLQLFNLATVHAGSTPTIRNSPLLALSGQTEAAATASMPVSASRPALLPVVNPVLTMNKVPVTNDGSVTLADAQHALRAPVAVLLRDVNLDLFERNPPASTEVQLAKPVEGQLVSAMKTHPGDTGNTSALRNELSSTPVVIPLIQNGAWPRKELKGVAGLAVLTTNTRGIPDNDALLPEDGGRGEVSEKIISTGVVALKSVPPSNLKQHAVETASPAGSPPETVHMPALQVNSVSGNHPAQLAPSLPASQQSVDDPPPSSSAAPSHAETSHTASGPPTSPAVTTNAFHRMDGGANATQLKFNPSLRSLAVAIPDAEQGVSTVRAQLIEGKLTASMTTSSTDTATMLHSQLGSLQTFMTQHGSPLTDLKIDLDHRGQRDPTPNRNQKEDEVPGNAPSLVYPSATTTVETRDLSVSLINLRV